MKKTLGIPPIPEATNLIFGKDGTEQTYSTKKNIPYNINLKNAETIRRTTPAPATVRRPGGRRRLRGFGGPEETAAGSHRQGLWRGASGGVGA